MKSSSAGWDDRRATASAAPANSIWLLTASPGRPWRIDLLAYTEANFGEVGRLRYERLLITAMRDIAAEPERIGSLSRPEFGQHVRSYHLRHSREHARTEHGIVLRPRHLLLYRFIHPDLIGIGRVLHDAMEIERHIPHDFDND